MNPKTGQKTQNVHCKLVPYIFDKTATPILYITDPKGKKIEGHQDNFKLAATIRTKFREPFVIVRNLHPLSALYTERPNFYGMQCPKPLFFHSHYTTYTSRFL